MNTEQTNKIQIIEYLAFTATLMGCTSWLLFFSYDNHIRKNVFIVALYVIGFFLFYVNHGIKGALARFIGFQVALIICGLAIFFVEVGFTSLNSAIENMFGGVSYVHAVHFFLMCLFCFYLLKKYG